MRARIPMESRSGFTSNFPISEFGGVEIGLHRNVDQCSSLTITVGAPPRTYSTAASILRPNEVCIQSRLPIEPMTKTSVLGLGVSLHSPPRSRISCWHARRVP